MEAILEKILISLIGIISALSTDYLVKRIREKKHNKWQGLIEIDNKISEKLKDYSVLDNITFLNRDTEKFLNKKKELFNKLNEFFLTQFNSHLDAQPKGLDLKKKIKKLRGKL